jgi:hypothetical protein
MRDRLLSTHLHASCCCVHRLIRLIQQRRLNATRRGGSLCPRLLDLTEELVAELVRVHVLHVVKHTARNLCDRGWTCVRCVCVCVCVVVVGSGV